MRDPFPLQWPEDTKRTKPDRRERSKFGHRSSGQVSFSQARQELLDELSRLSAVNAVITSDLPVRHDNLPYANGRADDSGVAVWFMLPDDSGVMRETVLACDRWRSHAENMTAIARTIEAMRGIDRWGVGEARSKAFAGFAALPPGSSGTIDSAPARRPWREVLGGSWAGLDRDELLILAKARHRKLIKEAHPDAGGDAAIAAELNAALDEAEHELLATTKEQG